MSLISKQIDELRAYAKDRKGELAKLINDAADTIEMLSAKIRAATEKEPGEDVKPVVHGEWIDGTKRQTCSICRYRGVRSWTYCPNCGAKMDEEKQDG